MARRTISAVTSPGGRSVPEHAAMPAAIVAMLFWASPRPATSSASRSGIIWAADSRWSGTWSFNHSTITSEGGSDPLDRRRRPHFSPYYRPTTYVFDLSKKDLDTTFVGM